MKRRIMTSCLAILALALSAQDLPVSAHTLPNGMRVLLVERHEEPTIACGWVARVGSADERPGITGIAHLFEHMMFKGTKRIGTRNARRDAELNALQDQTVAELRKEIDGLRERLRRGEIQRLDDPGVRSARHQELLDTLAKQVQEQRSLVVKDELAKLYAQAGATGLNANTTQDRTFFHVTVPANKLALWAWLESDRLQNAVFREFYSERDVVLEERRQRTDATPFGKLNEAFNAMIWHALPYSWPVIGWPSDITAVTRDQADQFFATYYAPSNLTAILVGDFKSGEALDLLQTYFGSIPDHPGARPKVITLEPSQPGEQRLSATADATPMVTAAYKCVASVHGDAPALKVLAGILNGQSGRLNRELVQRRRAAVGAQAYVVAQKFGGVFYLSGTPASGQAPEEVEPLLYRELERIQKGGVTATELLKAKNQYEVDRLRLMDSNGGLLGLLAGAEGQGTYLDVKRHSERLQAVTCEDVQRVARVYLIPTNRTSMVIHRTEAK